jgi:hypothetical protein
MKTEDVVLQYRTVGIRVWIDGGWCIDALMGYQTREHSDPDIAIAIEDSTALHHLICPKSQSGGEQLRRARLSLDPTGGLPQMSYGRFAAMIAASTAIMFGLMYLNTFATDHIWYSQTRTWMALLMGAVMAAVMLSFMWSMYKSRTANTAILIASIAVFAVSLWLVRSQQTVSDIAYMKAMIPHHSIAVLTSERAHIRDPRVRKLADSIIEAQVKEIGEMETLIADLEAKPTPASAKDLPPRPPN